MINPPRRPELGNIDFNKLLNQSAERAGLPERNSFAAQQFALNFASQGLQKSRPSPNSFQPRFIQMDLPSSFAPSLARGGQRMVFEAARMNFASSPILKNLENIDSATQQTGKGGSSTSGFLASAANLLFSIFG